MTGSLHPVHELGDGDCEVRGDGATPAREARAVAVGGLR